MELTPKGVLFSFLFPFYWISMIFAGTGRMASHYNNSDKTPTTHKDSSANNCSEPDLSEHGVYAGVKGIWAVHHADAQTDTGLQLDVQGGPHHTYLLMSHPSTNETKILETGEELGEADANNGFMMQAPTIVAGNVLNHTLIVQVRLALVTLACNDQQTMRHSCMQALMFTHVWVLSV